MKNKRKAKDLLLKIAIYFCAALVSVLALVGIIGYIFWWRASTFELGYVYHRI